MTIPNKCLTCPNATVELENVHKGWLKYQLESVVRCECSPQRFRVGCVCAEVYCDRKGNKE